MKTDTATDPQSNQFLTFLLQDGELLPAMPTDDPADGCARRLETM